MRSFGWMILVAIGLGTMTACGGDTSNLTEEIEALKRRVQNLEKRVKTIEGKGSKKPAAKGKAPPSKAKQPTTKAKQPAKAGGANGGAAKAAKGKSGGAGTAGKAPAKPKSKVEVDGNAKKVLLSNGKRKFPMPGSVAAGEYTILVAFGDATKASEAGKVTIEAEKTAKITCTEATKTCTAK